MQTSRLMGSIPEAVLEPSFLVQLTRVRDQIIDRISQN